MPKKNKHEAKEKAPSKNYGRSSPTIFKDHVHEDHINVNVVVNEKQEDCLTSCFQSCFKAAK